MTSGNFTVKFLGFLLFFNYSLNQSDKEKSFFEGYKMRENVIFPTIKQYQKLKEQFEYSLVYFHSDHCTHCKSFTKEYLQIAKAMKTKKSDLPVISIICGKTGFGDLCNFKEKITDFPTLRLYHHDDFIQYAGKWKAVNVVYWIRDRTVFSKTKIDKHNMAHFIEVLKHEEMVVIFYNGDDDYKERRFKEYSKIAHQCDYVHFYHTGDDEVYTSLMEICDEFRKDSEGVESDFMLLHPDHHKCYFYSGIFNYKKILKFIHDKEKPMLRLFDEHSMKMHHHYQLPIVVLFYKDENLEFFQTYLSITEKMHPFFVFTHVNEDAYNGNYYEQDMFKTVRKKVYKKDNINIRKLMIKLGVEVEDWPCLYVYKHHNKKFHAKWKYEGDFSPQSVHKFLDQVHHRKIKSFFKHESFAKIRRKNKKSKIEYISALNFDEKVKSQKNIFLLITGGVEMCEDCHNIEDILYDAIQEYVKDSYFQEFPYPVYQMNIQLNELEDWYFEHIPEIIFYKDADKISHYNYIMSIGLIEHFFIETISSAQNSDFNNGEL